MNYCSQCGYKLDGEFNFCPNCGSKIEAANYASNESQNDPSSIIICKNCGEENAMEDSICFSCGVPLSSKKLIKKTQLNSELKEKSNDRKDSRNVQNASNEKTLDTKKILLVFAFVILIFIIILITTDVFDSAEVSGTAEIKNQSSDSSVDLANLEEINQLQAKVDANPDDLESTLHLAHLQQDAGLPEKAIENYKKYLIKFPENADARVDMAICYYNLNDYNTAITEMETAIKYKPNHQIAYLNLGIVNLAAKNIEASKDWFNKTVELDPNSEAGKRAQELLHSH